MDKKQTGDFGEKFCCDFLSEKGYCVVSRNYHSRYGEIDVIAEDEKYIVFVEVKTRSKNSLGNPCEAVTASKRKKIILTAMQYLQEKDITKQPRFDVSEVWIQGEKIIKQNYIENAFDSMD